MPSLVATANQSTLSPGSVFLFLFVLWKWPCKEETHFFLILDFFLSWFLRNEYETCVFDAAGGGGGACVRAGWVKDEWMGRIYLLVCLFAFALICLFVRAFLLLYFFLFICIVLFGLFALFCLFCFVFIFVWFWFSLFEFCLFEFCLSLICFCFVCFVCFVLCDCLSVSISFFVCLFSLFPCSRCAHGVIVIVVCSWCMCSRCARLADSVFAYAL